MLAEVCGRFVQSTPPERLRRSLEQLVGASVALEGEAEPWGPRWNVAPRSVVVACRVGPGTGTCRGPVLGRLRWGLVPSFVRDVSVAPAPHNLRLETVLGRPGWRRLAEHRRAVVPADAFFEWRAKRPSAFARALGAEPGTARRAPLWLAALWDSRTGEDALLGSVAILTQPSGAVVGEVHDRQPVCVPDTLVSRWLDPGPLGSAALDGLLSEITEASEVVALEGWPVGAAVNRVGAEGPELLSPLPRGGVSSP
jgi:putative SOS response-associated peptidase YedK